MSRVKIILTDAHFKKELENAGHSLVVVDFFATWCGPCCRMSPKIDVLSERFTKAVFVKVDVDKCEDTAMNHGISSMPTFIFYKNKEIVDKMAGANERLLEELLKKHYKPYNIEDPSSDVDFHGTQNDSNDINANENDGNANQDGIDVNELTSNETEKTKSKRKSVAKRLTILFKKFSCFSKKRE